ncbi:hypothetical protein Ccrd_025914, partial [Cynara cardunculus var. scolymus]
MLVPSLADFRNAFPMGTLLDKNQQWGIICKPVC